MNRPEPCEREHHHWLPGHSAQPAACPSTVLLAVSHGGLVLGRRPVQDRYVTGACSPAVTGTEPQPPESQAPSFQGRVRIVASARSAEEIPCLA